MFQVCSTLVHVVGLVIVDDVHLLGSLLAEKFNILSIHLRKYISTVAAEQADKGSRNAEFFLIKIA